MIFDSFSRGLRCVFPAGPRREDFSLPPCKQGVESELKEIIGEKPAVEKLETSEKLVEFVRGVKIGFEFPRTELFAQIINAAGKEIERRGEHFLVRQNDVAPRGVGTPRQTKSIAKSGACERDRQSILVKSII